MSHPAPPIARRLALFAVLFGALAVLLPVALAPIAARAHASVPATVNAPEPAPSGTASPSAAPLPPAQVNLTRSACDAVHLTARTDAAVTLAYRVADESGNVVASGTFTGTLERVVSVSTGHDYTATVSEPASVTPLATSAPASLRDACPVSVTADAPGFVDPCGTQRDAVMVPTIIGVDYRVGGALLAPGPNSATGIVTVEASARPGYVLNGPSRWTHAFNADPCLSAAPVPAGPQEPAPADPAPAPATPPAASSQDRPAALPSAAASSAPTAELQREDASARAAAQPALQASVGGPGPLEWGIMIAVAVAGGVAFWLKTRH